MTKFFIGAGLFCFGVYYVCQHADTVATDCATVDKIGVCDRFAECDVLLSNHHRVNITRPMVGDTHCDYKSVWV